MNANKIRNRGRIMSFFQCAVNLGILTAFWIQYGTSHIAGSAAWRVPMGLQMIVSVLLLHKCFCIRRG